MTAWADRVQAHIDTWSKALPDRAWWPRFVYHFTEISNVVSILQEGTLYSRAGATRLNLVRTDVASPDVIAQTAPAHLQYARLYFRPRTPTQFRNEGIRPKGDLWGKAHCPVPVFLCFDAAHVLCLPDTEISNGNMASPHVAHGPVQDMLDRAPFADIFHDGPFSKQDTHITFHRCAEVLVPKALELAPSLKMIVCRSPAERTMLLHQLPEPVRSRWAPRVRIDYQALFERRWTFVETVGSIGTTVEFHLNPSSRAPGPFYVKVVYREGAGLTWTWEERVQSLISPLRVDLEGATRGVIRLTLDDRTAFSGPIIFEDIPF